VARSAVNQEDKTFFAAMEVYLLNETQPRIYTVPTARIERVILATV
jgi:hypothetical protein